MNNIDATLFIGKSVEVIVDRPMGSLHPKHGYVYPINYGYIANTLADDGAELDAYLLGVNKPVSTYFGACIAVIIRINDADDKLIVVPEHSHYSDDEIRSLTFFQEQWFTSTIVRK